MKTHDHPLNWGLIMTEVLSMNTPQPKVTPFHFCPDLGNRTIGQSSQWNIILAVLRIDREMSSRPQEPPEFPVPLPPIRNQMHDIERQHGIQRCIPERNGRISIEEQRNNGVNSSMARFSPDGSKPGVIGIQGIHCSLPAHSHSRREGIMARTGAKIQHPVAVMQAYGLQKFHTEPLFPGIQEFL